MVAEVSERHRLGKQLRDLLDSPVHTKTELDAWYQRARNLEVWLTSHDVGSDIPELLWHYLADADIRLKDSEYAEGQESQIRKLVAELESEFRNQE